MFVLMKSGSSLKIGHVGSKIRSQDQMSEKPCVRFKDHIFYSILMKLCQNVGLDKILDEFEKGSCGVKTSSLSQILEKPCERSRHLILVKILIKLGQKCLPWQFSGWVWKYVRCVKSRSLGQILESQSRRLIWATPGPLWPSCKNTKDFWD